MKTPRVLLALLASVAFTGALRSAQSSDLTWPALTRENKPWTRWWWLGSAVDKPNLTRELEAIAAAGFGGVEITPIYGAKGYEDRFIPFLSPKYMEMLAHVGAEAKRLGLGVDMATGTGWPFGGPEVSGPDVELKLAFGPDGKIAPVPTGFKVKRSAPGGEGFVLNPYSTIAMTHYLAPFTKALGTLSPGTINSQFHDSFEYQANWANEVPMKFKVMHGYDIHDHAAELSGKGDPDTVARIKADYRTTLGALHLDYVRTWVDWAHSLGQTARNQAHGAPGNLLDLYAAADIPETEIFGSIPFPIPGFRRDPAEVGRSGHPPIIHRFASSAAHVMGKPLASSETFTWLREHFHESPSEMKPELDELFLAGINHIYYHGNAYSPEDAPWPGWLFYASSQLNTRNPLWRDLGDGLNAYIARAQSLLQAGQPDNEFLVYWPVDDLWHNPEGQQIQLTVHASWLENTPCGKLMDKLVQHGYQFDLISDAQLQQVRHTHEYHDGFKTPGGATYHTLIVPRTVHMPVETLRQILTLAGAGANVWFIDELPSDVPGFGSIEERRSQLKAELNRLIWDDAGPDKKHITARIGRGIGRVWMFTLADSFNRSWEPTNTTDLGALRRCLPDGYIYFLVNRSARPVEDWITLRKFDSSGSAFLMDARTGQITAAHPSPRNTKGSDSVFIQLQPGESIFVRTISGNRYAKNPVTAKATRYMHPAGTPVALDSNWRVTAFRGGPELPPAFSQHGFGSWTTQGGEWERFGGTARYETEFTLPAGTKADDWRLDLGDVRETARIYVNGQEVDLLWSLPMRTNIGSALQPGKNTLALEVTNLAANRIRDLERRKVEWKKFHEINFVNIFYRPFDGADWPMQPSGLLGPVQLVPLQAFTP
jgi:hypothetical protein